jgi:hypothetical protein
MKIKFFTENDPLFIHDFPSSLRIREKYEGNLIDILSNNIGALINNRVPNWIGHGGLIWNIVPTLPGVKSRHVPLDHAVTLEEILGLNTKPPIFTANENGGWKGWNHAQIYI